MDDNIKKSIQILIFFALLLTPLFSALEIVALLTTGLTSQVEALTPTYLKLLKDGFFIVMILLGIVKIAWSREINKYAVFCIIIILVLTYNILFSLINNQDFLIILAGIRWSMPVLLLFFLISNVDQNSMQRVAKGLLILFIIHLLLQIFQLFNMQLWHGTNMFGLAARTPGIFIIPNTAAFFSIICLFFFQYYYGFKKMKSKIFIYGLVGLSTFLTMSGTGIIVFLLLTMMFITNRRYIKYVLATFPVFVILLLAIIPSIAGRSDAYVETSLGTRLQIFIDELVKSSFFTDSFGIGTNTAILLNESSGKILDSTYASIIANTGLAGFLLFLLLLACWIFYIVKQNRMEMYAFSLIFLLFGATTIVFEVYPINLLFATSLAYFLFPSNFNGERQ